MTEVWASCHGQGVGETTHNKSRTNKSQRDMVRSVLIPDVETHAPLDLTPSTAGRRAPGRFVGCDPRRYESSRRPGAREYSDRHHSQVRRKPSSKLTLGS